VSILANAIASSQDPRIAGARSRPLLRVPILMYHEITSRPTLAGHLAVTPDEFAEQLAYLTASGYTTLTAADLVQGMAPAVAGPGQRAPAVAEPDQRAPAWGEAGQAVAGLPRQWPAKPVVLTFDDGFADFHDAALPLLDRHGFTATLFVTTGWVAGGEVTEAGTTVRGSRAGSRAPRGMLCWSQIAEAASVGIEIGAHSHRHPQLDQLGGDLLRVELEVSKAVLEDRLGKPVTGLAYPFGYSNLHVRAAASAARYRYACAVGNRLAGDHADPFALPRLTIGRWIRMQSFSRIVRGERLPPEILAYRAMTKGWAAVRRARSGLGRITQ
jgi:peptidoglycan/xylan/chitin deacetylase (PgdA/CDA1 family)